MKIATNVLAVLDQATISGNTLTLTGQLEPAAYKAVAKIIEMAGGKWNRKAKCHLFTHDAAETIEPLLLTGEISDAKKDFGQFDTPAAIAKLAARNACIRPGMTVLEPNVGLGNLAMAAEDFGAHVSGYEIDARRLEKAKQRCEFLGGFALKDFLQVPPAAIYDIALMNPPFAGQADIIHVTHAFKFVKPGGRLVAIMSNGVEFRTNKATVAFRELMDRHDGEITRLPEGAFKESGTGVNTVMVSMDARQQ